MNILNAMYKFDPKDFNYTLPCHDASTDDYTVDELNKLSTEIMETRKRFERVLGLPYDTELNPDGIWTIYGKYFFKDEETMMIARLLM